MKNYRFELATNITKNIGLKNELGLVTGFVAIRDGEGKPLFQIPLEAESHNKFIANAKRIKIKILNGE